MIVNRHPADVMFCMTDTVVKGLSLATSGCWLQLDMICLWWLMPDLLAVDLHVPQACCDASPGTLTTMFTSAAPSVSCEHTVIMH